MRLIFLVVLVVSSAAQASSDLAPYEATTVPAIMEHNFRKMAACGEIKLESGDGKYSNGVDALLMMASPLRYER